jgi:polyisoprenoid-binding protein YceI
MIKNQSGIARGSYGWQLLGGAVLSLALGLSFPGTAAAQTATWNLDQAHTLSRFTVRHLMVSNVRGGFSKTTGTVQYDPADPTKMMIDATIDTTTVDTGVAARDNDLRMNYLEVDKYPTITFQSKHTEAAGGGNLKVTGDLTIRGVTKEVVLDVTDITGPVKNGATTHMGAVATTKISRKDFGMVRNPLMEGGGAIVGDEVSISIDIDMAQGGGRGRGAAQPSPAPAS